MSSLSPSTYGDVSSGLFRQEPKDTNETYIIAWEEILPPGPSLVKTPVLWVHLPRVIA